MKDKKKVFTPRFKSIYFLTMFALFTCAAIGLGYFWLLLEEYEKRTPDYTARIVFAQYFDDVDCRVLYELEKPKLSEIETYNDYEAYLGSKIETGDMSFLTAPTGTPDIKKYNVFSGGVRLAEFELIAAEESGKLIWELSRLNTLLDKSLLTVEVLDGFTLFINNVEIGEEYLISEGIRKPEADRLNLKYKRYQIATNLGISAIKVVDNYDREGALTSEGQKFEQEIIYDKGLEAEYKKLAEDAAKTYAKFMTNDAKLSELRGFFETGTATYEALRKSEVHWYTDHIGYRFENIEAKEFYDHGGGAFSCRVTLDQYIKRTETDTRLFPLDITLFFRPAGGKFLVFDLIGNAQ